MAAPGRARSTTGEPGMPLARPTRMRHLLTAAAAA